MLAIWSIVVGNSREFRYGRSSPRFVHEQIVSSPSLMPIDDIAESRRVSKTDYPYLGILHNEILRRQSIILVEQYKRLLARTTHCRRHNGSARANHVQGDKAPELKVRECPKSVAHTTFAIGFESRVFLGNGWCDSRLWE